MPSRISVFTAVYTHIYYIIFLSKGCYVQQYYVIILLAVIVALI